MNEPSHNLQHEYFDLAYRTGSDIWTHIPYHNLALTMLPPIPADSIVLDVGSGRGLWAFKLIDHGFRVIGLDYIQSIVDRVNADIKLNNMQNVPGLFKVLQPIFLLLIPVFRWSARLDYYNTSQNLIGIIIFPNLHE
jgi:SAM-dependent methyltransferase